MTFPDSSAGKESTCSVGDPGSIPGLGRSPGEGKGYLFQYSGLKNAMDCVVYGVAKSQTRLSDLHLCFSSNVVQKDSDLTIYSGITFLMKGPVPCKT